MTNVTPNVLMTAGVPITITRGKDRVRWINMNCIVSAGRVNDRVTLALNDGSLEHVQRSDNPEVFDALVTQLALQFSAE